MVQSVFEETWSLPKTPKRGSKLKINELQSLVAQCDINFPKNQRQNNSTVTTSRLAMKQILLSLTLLGSMPLLSKDAAANPTATVGSSANAAAVPEPEVKRKGAEAD